MGVWLGNVLLGLRVAEISNLNWEQVSTGATDTQMLRKWRPVPWTQFLCQPWWRPEWGLRSD